MAARKPKATAGAEVLENPSLSSTTFHDTPEEAFEQIESFFNSIGEDKHFSVECFTTDKGVQVTVSQHQSK